MYLSRIFRMPLLWLLTANLILPCTAAPAPDATRTTKGDAILEGRQAGGGTPTSSQPCATVSNYIARGSNFVPVTLARACLESVPLDKERDAALIDL